MGNHDGYGNSISCFNAWRNINNLCKQVNQKKTISFLFHETIISSFFSSSEPFSFFSLVVPLHKPSSKPLSHVTTILNKQFRKAFTHIRKYKRREPNPFLLYDAPTTLANQVKCSILRYMLFQNRKSKTRNIVFQEPLSQNTLFPLLGRKMTSELKMF